MIWLCRIIWSGLWRKWHRIWPAALVRRPELNRPIMAQLVPRVTKAHRSRNALHVKAMQGCSKTIR
jgi:hypothetical protein